jgi:hypothetical protein
VGAVLLYFTLRCLPIVLLFACENASCQESLKNINSGTSRTIFIPGFGENISIFDSISQHIEGEKIFVDNWLLLKTISKKKFSAEVYAQHLVRHYNIKEADVVVGHSMGGWVALHIKQLVGCKIVQIASWTNRRKVIGFPVFAPVVYLLAQTPLVFNRFNKQILINLYYKNKPSQKIFSSVVDNLIYGNKSIVVKQLKIILKSVDKPITVKPDMRIHARADRLVKFPDEAFIIVPGDHFTLVTHPGTVYKPIIDFIKQQY